MEKNGAQVQLQIFLISAACYIPKLDFLDIFLINKGCVLYMGVYYIWKFMVLFLHDNNLNQECFLIYRVNKDKELLEHKLRTAVAAARTTSMDPPIRALNAPQAAAQHLAPGEHQLQNLKCQNHDLQEEVTDVFDLSDRVSQISQLSYCFISL